MGTNRQKSGVYGMKETINPIWFPSLYSEVELLKVVMEAATNGVVVFMQPHPHMYYIYTTLELGIYIGIFYIASFGEVKSKICHI